MKKLLTFMLITVLALSCLLAGCKDDQKESSSQQKAQPESIEITNTQTTVSAGEFEITAKVYPENADQRYTVSVVGAPAGITVSGNKVTVASTTENGLTFTIKVVSLLDMIVDDKMVFTVENQLSDAVQIRTPEELSAIRNDLSGNYILMNDIDLQGAQWQPIGTPDLEDDRGNITTVGVGFAGRLNGNGFAIKNFYFNDSTAELVGLFAQIEKTGVVEKLQLEGSMNAYRWFGALAGLNHGTIRNCFIDVDIVGAGSPACAIAGNNKGTVENTIAIGSVEVQSGIHGAAFVGSTDGNVVASYAHSGNIPYAFGWGKQPSTSIQKTEAQLKTAATYSAWDPNVWYTADGIYPMLKHPGFEPPAAEILVSVSNTERFVDVKAGTTSMQINAVVKNATNSAVEYSLKEAVEGVSINASGLLTFANSVADNSYVTVVVTSKEDANKKAEYTLKINNFDKSTYIDVASLDDLLKYLVNTDDPADLNKNYRLTNNVEILEGQWYNSNIGANAGVAFTGIFDGNGYAINGLQGGEGKATFGLFKEIGVGGVVKNLAVVIGSGRMYVGAASAIIAGTNRGTIENIYVEGEIMSTGVYVAGIAFDNYGVIKNVICRAHLLINESATSKATVGAIAYNNQNGGSIENCFADRNYTNLASLLGTANPTLDANCLDDAGMKTAANFASFNSEIWRIVDGEIPTFKSLAQ